jgi:acetyl-CoA carboxylase carboxyltransferase component
VNTANKQARFIRFCDAFNIPLVMLVDTAAYLPGREQEQSGTIRGTAKVLYALCEATVPRVSVVIRRSYGGAGNLSMGVNPGLGTDFVFAWPMAETSQMRSEQLVELFYGAEIAKAKNPEELRDQRIKEYRNWYANILSQASIRTHITDVIEPGETRKRLITTLKLLRGKKIERYPKRHGNIPL